MSSIYLSMNCRVHDLYQHHVKYASNNLKNKYFKLFTNFSIILHFYDMSKLFDITLKDRTLLYGQYYIAFYGFTGILKYE